MGHLLPCAFSCRQQQELCVQGQHLLHPFTGCIWGDPEEEQHQHPAVQQLGELKNQEQSLD